jgi:hypothetical protein
MVGLTSKGSGRKQYCHNLSHSFGLEGQEKATKKLRIAVLWTESSMDAPTQM